MLINGILGLFGLWYGDQWWHFCHWLQRRLSKWQILLQPVMQMSPKWHFDFSASNSCFKHSIRAIILISARTVRICCPILQFDSSVQECSICSALAMEILQSCTKPSKCTSRNICISGICLSNISFPRVCMNNKFVFILMGDLKNLTERDSFWFTGEFPLSSTKKIAQLFIK